ncbi:helix-turn-helix domain-containing protein [Anoxynatronum buryatiense]|uniref:Transcriptional regulator, XRE family with cupin sensor n=1 Tax=Anoxynatronum buryatiense TaxID=489973 RepID=A0AA45WZA1_9CLOT|nr:XRE family transcriptional regulator [Anoxynatronum buryatiense]SMP72177.1 transcriptional regulator, XRE family with cupin sensor [Anoxynatronum buryatiense]
MDDISQVIAGNLKELREQRRLSLDRVAELTGVSKSMLGQIERGESNPTIQTIWKMANGLKVSLTTLIDRNTPETVVVKRSTVSPAGGNDGKIQIYPVFPFDPEKRFEVINLELSSGAYSPSEPHADGAEEYLMVLEGDMNVTVGGEVYALEAGDAIRYRADQSHAYSRSDEAPTLTKACMVIVY